MFYEISFTFLPMLILLQIHWSKLFQFAWACIFRDRFCYCYLICYKFIILMDHIFCGAAGLLVIAVITVFRPTVRKIFDSKVRTYSILNFIIIIYYYYY